MTTYFPPKVSTQYIFYASLVSQANTKVMQANPTIASGDFKVSIDGGALANLGTLPTVTPASGVMVKFTLSTSEMAGANATVVCSDAAGAEWCDAVFNIQTTARQIDDLAYPATSGRSMVVDASGLVDANAVKVGPTGSGTAQTARDIGLSVLLAAGQKVDVDTIKTNPVVNGGTVTFPTNATLASTTNITAGTITTVTTVTNQLTAAAIATGVWQDATAGDFTTANSIGKALYIANIAPGAAGGHFIAGTNAATTITGSLTTTFTGNLTGSVASVTGLTASDVGAIKTQTDKLTFTVANQLDVNVLDWKSSAAPAMTGDAFARLGAPAGASVSADIAAAKVDTAAIKLKTDNLPSSPAATGDAMTLTAAYDAAKSAASATTAAAIKAKTDQLTFTVANQVDSNAESMNATTINGTGISGDLWRGA